MKRLARIAAVAAIAAATTVAGIAPALAADPGWTVKYEGALGTPSPYDIRTVWSGTCATPGEYFSFTLLKETERTENSALYKVLGSGRVICEQNNTYRAELMHYGYGRDNYFSLAKGTTYDVQFMASNYFDRATVTI